MLFRYQERMHITYAEALETPWNAVERASYIWSLEAQRDKLEAKRQQFK